jgi:hypothetical protein
MRKFIFFAAAALLSLVPAASRAQAQIDEHRFEAGVVFTAIGAESLDQSSKGLGARLTYNFTDNFALDAEGSLFPRDSLGNNQTAQNVQGFVGVKAGARSRYVGVFGKVRPGVMSIGNSVSGFDCDSRGSFNVCRPERSHLALDAGLVTEFYPTSRTIVRLDLGDTIVRFNSAGRNVFDGTQVSSSDVTHNFQVSLGFGYRF